MEKMQMSSKCFRSVTDSELMHFSLVSHKKIISSYSRTIAVVYNILL